MIPTDQTPPRPKHRQPPAVLAVPAHPQPFDFEGFVGGIFIGIFFGMDIGFIFAMITSLSASVSVVSAGPCGSTVETCPWFARRFDARLVQTPPRAPTPSHRFGTTPADGHKTHSLWPVMESLDRSQHPPPSRTAATHQPV